MNSVIVVEVLGVISIMRYQITCIVHMSLVEVLGQSVLCIMTLVEVIGQSDYLYCALCHLLKSKANQITCVVHMSLV